MLTFLSRHSIIGIISGVGASFIQYLNEIEPYIKVFGFIAGIVIAILTIYAKLLEIKQIKSKRKFKS